MPGGGQYQAAFNGAFSGPVSFGPASIAGPITQQVYTVAALPAGAVGRRAFVSDATAPTWGVAVVGLGLVPCPVFHDGTSWKVG